MPEIARRVPAEREDLLHRGGVHPRLRARCSRCIRSLPGPGLLPAARCSAIAYADFFRGVPTILVIAMLGLRRAGAAAAAACRTRRRSGGSSRSCSSTPRTSPRSTAPGSSRCTRARTAAARSLGLTHLQALQHGGPAAGGAARDPAAAERLHRPAEGHGARRLPRLDRGVQAVADRRGGDVQLHAVRRRGGAVRRADDPARALHRLAGRCATAGGARRRASR